MIAVNKEYLKYFKGKKVLITGGAGFIGSNLAKWLVKLEAQVTVIDSLIPEYGGNLYNLEPIKDKISINISDVRDPYSIDYLIQDKDYLFNLAGQTSHLDSMKNPFQDLDINAKAQLSVLESCRKFNPMIRIVFASTRQLYGAPQYLPVDESHSISPVDVNGINKFAGEWYHLVYNNVYGIKSTVLRLTNTYGPGMRIKDARQTFLGIWINRLIAGEPILVYGTGEQKRDFNYVDDVVDAILLSSIKDNAVGEIFNLGSKDVVSLKDVAKLMVKLRSGSYKIVPFPDDLKKIDIGDYFSDYSKISKLLGWRPKVSLKEGILRTIEYYENNKDYYLDNSNKNRVDNKTKGMQRETNIIITKDKEDSCSNDIAPCSSDLNSSSYKVS